MEKEQRELEERVKRIMQSLVNKYGILGLVKIRVPQGDFLPNTHERFVAYKIMGTI